MRPAVEPETTGMEMVEVGRRLRLRVSAAGRPSERPPLLLCNGLGIDAVGQLEQNFAKFEAKWGREHTAGYRLPERR